MVHPEAMIRMGEVYEQGFYGVKPNLKKANFYYKEGTRILSLLVALRKILLFITLFFSPILLSNPMEI